jgi:glucokinase
MGILGIDLGGTKVRAGLVENNTLLKVESLLLSKKGTATEVLNDINNLINRFSKHEIVGIGIGVPGVVDVENGIVYDVQNIPYWEIIHLGDMLKVIFDVPVYINNDANCFAVGEKYFGKAQYYQDIVGLILGTGLGAGIIVNHKLYEGRNCGAGEYGMLPYKNKNFEYYCSGHYFVNEFNTTGEELFRRAEKGETEAIDIFSGFGANVGEVIKAIMYTVDPEIIVLGGSVSKSYKFFKDEMYKSIGSFAYSRSVKNIKIEVSGIDNVAVLGAAALYYNYVGK